MPPKVKVTRETIVKTALNVVRGGGEGALNARLIAALLGCSTQPIFSNFENMEKLKEAVVEKAGDLYKEYMAREVAEGKYPAYKASGMAYIRFAKEEKELFKLLFMCDRRLEAIPDDDELKTSMEQIVQSSTGLGMEETELFHLEMWAYVHGIAVMFATGYVGLEWELVSKMLTDAYLGLCKQYGME